MATTARINNALKRLGSGWALFVEAERREAQRTIRSPPFPDALSWLVEEERRGAFEAAGSHFESVYTLTSSICRRRRRGPGRAGSCSSPRTHVTVDWREQLAAFVTETDRFLGLLEAVMPEIAWLDDGRR